MRKILLANTHFERQFGYERGELLGQSVERLIPERLRTQSPDRPSVFVVLPGDVSLSHRRDLVGLRKDGTEFPLTMTLTPLLTVNGMSVVGAIDRTQGTA